MALSGTGDNQTRGAFSSRSHIAILFFAGFVIAASISTALSEAVTLIAVQRVASFAIQFAVAWLFPVPTHPEVRMRVWTWSVAAVVVLVVGLSLLCFQASFAWANGRLRGVTDNANTLGGLSAIGLLLPMAVIRVRRSWLYSLVIMVASCICLALSQSRASAIAAGGGLAFTLLITKCRQTSIVMTWQQSRPAQSLPITRIVFFRTECRRTPFCVASTSAVDPLYGRTSWTHGARAP
jgi:hypothetical protein